MKSEPISYLNAEFWVSSDDLDNNKCREFTIFEDKGLIKPAISLDGDIMMIQKLDSDEAILEWGGGGAGFATWGGGAGRNFGNPSMGRSFYGRGFGFGSSNTGSGSQSMYTYDVKPLNQTLEPPGSALDDGQQLIHIGSVVKGKILGKKKHITGQIQSIKQDNNNNIKYYVVRDPDTAMTHKIDPTAIFIWEPENEGPHPGASDIPTVSGVGRSGTTRENINIDNFYPRLFEELSGSEAIYGFAGWLTTQDEKTIMSSKDDASDIAKKIGKFCETNKLEDPKDNWEKGLKHPTNEHFQEPNGDAYKKLKLGKYKPIDRILQTGGKWKLGILLRDIKEKYEETEDTEEFRKSIIYALENIIDKIEKLLDEDDVDELSTILYEFNMLDQYPTEDELNYIIEMLYDWGDINDIWIDML